MKINVDANVKNWFIKTCVINNVFGTHSSCECECDKSFDIGEYLDYSNCKCREKTNW